MFCSYVFCTELTLRWLLLARTPGEVGGYRMGGASSRVCVWYAILSEASFGIGLSDTAVISLLLGGRDG